MPILTIITIHLDDFNGLLRTCQSLRSTLSTENVEWIIVDGGSATLSREQSSTRDLVRSYATRFISEPDDGIYFAMNKGTQLASGAYVLYLNAGDELHPDFSFEKLTKAIKTSGDSMIWGRADVRDQTETVYPRKTRHPAWLRYGTAVCHQAVFFKRSVLGSHPYDTNLTIAADYDLICRLYTHDNRIITLDMRVCIFDLVGKSGLDKRLTLSEESRVRQKYFFIPDFFNRVITEFKYVMWQIGTVIPSFRRAWSRVF